MPYAHNGVTVARLRAQLVVALRGYLLAELVGVVADVLIWTLQPGSLLDARGVTAGLNMHWPAQERWDVCEVLEVDEIAVHLQPVDRLHPYPFFYPNFAPRTAWVAFTTNRKTTRLAPYLSQVARPGIVWPSGGIEAYEKRLAPYLSQVARPGIGCPSGGIEAYQKYADAGWFGGIREYDLIDVRDQQSGKWCCAEIAANIGTALWVIMVDRYRSPEHKESCREWIGASDARYRIARYRSRYGRPDSDPIEPPDPTTPPLLNDRDAAHAAWTQKCSDPPSAMLQTCLQMDPKGDASNSASADMKEDHHTGNHATRNHATGDDDWTVVVSRRRKVRPKRCRPPHIKF
jgi:hypothetical protein